MNGLLFLPACDCWWPLFQESNLSGGGALLGRRPGNAISILTPSPITWLRKTRRWRKEENMLRPGGRWGRISGEVRMLEPNRVHASPHHFALHFSLPSDACHVLRRILLRCLVSGYAMSSIGTQSFALVFPLVVSFSLSSLPRAPFCALHAACNILLYFLRVIRTCDMKRA